MTGRGRLPLSEDLASFGRTDGGNGGSRDLLADSWAGR